MYVFNSSIFSAISSVKWLKLISLVLIKIVVCISTQGSAGLRLRINGKTAVSYDSNLNEIMEFNFLTSCLSGNTNEWSRSMNSLLDEKYILYIHHINSFNQFINDPVCNGFIGAATEYNNANGITETVTETDVW